MTAQRTAQFRRVITATIGIALFAFSLADSTAWAQYGGGGGGGGGRGGGRHGSNSDSSDSKSDYKPLPAPAALLPHAGDYVSTETNYYEVVYMPFQTRIYLYDSKFKPLSSRDVHATMSLQFPLEAAPRQVTFQHVPMPAGATEQDFVAAGLDIRPLADKEASVTLEFSGLAGRLNPTATFTPHYDHFAIRPYVVQAALVESDRDAVNRQRNCPVSGAPLGSRGQIVKLYVTDIPLYLAGEDCIAAVKESPRKYVPQAPPPPGPAH
jgi:hypothetical protein